MKITSLQSSEVSDFLTLLQANQLPIEDLEAEKMSDFFTLKDSNGKLLGGIGLEKHKQYGLLRSLVVESSARNQQGGQKLVNQTLELAQNQGLKAIYLLTTTAKDYFLKLDFKVVNRENVPAEIQTTSEFSSVCPSTATVMVKIL
jgi:amino-acid N-acetyltransferase